jgi:hypothetical protein
MAQLGSGNIPSFPLAIDSRQTWQNAAGAGPDSETRLDSEAFNDFAAAIIAIETALGAMPQGVYGSVAARLQQFLPGGNTAAGLIAFSNTTAVSIPGTLSNLGSPAVLFQVYDAAIPAAALSTEMALVTIDQSTYTLAASFGQMQSGIVVLSASPPIYVTTFIGATSLTIPGTVHQLGTKNLLFQVYDNATPAAAIDPESLTIHPSTFDVALTFGQPQTGIVILGAPGPQYVATFTSQTTVTIPGTTHNLGTKALLFQIYNNATPAAWVAPETVTVHPTTFDVVVTFGQAQSGSIVLCTAPSVTGNDFEIRDGGITDRTAVRVFSFGGNLYLQPGGGEHLYIRHKTGQVLIVDIDTGTGWVGLGKTPSTHQLDLSTDLARKLTTSTWATLSDARLKEVLRVFPDGRNVLMALKPVVFRYNGQGGIPASKEEHIGFLAQDVQQVAPYMVTSHKGKLIPDGDETDILTLNTHALIHILTNSVQELVGEVQTLKAQVQVLQAKGP